jgi:hypothetical protein
MSFEILFACCIRAASIAPDANLLESALDEWGFALMEGLDANVAALSAFLAEFLESG